MPPWCYTSEAFYKREVDRLFMKVWNFLGRVEQVPNPGDYFTLDFAGVPLIIVRGDDNEVRAFANTCRHRGSQLLEGKGSCKAIVCPYHSWTYKLNGELAGAPEMEETVGFRNEDHGLVPLRLETLGRIHLRQLRPTRGAARAIWAVSRTRSRLPARGHGARAAARVRHELQLEALRRERERVRTTSRPCTRKTINQYASAKTAGYWVEEAKGEYCITFAQHEGSMALLKGAAGFPVIESLAGRREAGGTYAPLIYPSTYLACTIDCAWYLELHPLGVNRTRLVHGALFPRTRQDRPDFDDARRELLPPLGHHDRRGHRRLRSPAAGARIAVQPARAFSHREPLVHVIDNWILDRVLDPA